MSHIFNTLDENYILFENKKINVIIDNLDVLWFNAGQLAKIIGYLDTNKAIKQHTGIEDRIQFKNINHSYNIKQHPQTMYINESGMYKIILRSKMPKTNKFSNWVTQEVLPSIRKYGYYKMKKIYEDDKNNLLQKINYLEKQNKLMKSDMKKNKYPSGALVYVVDYSDDDENQEGIFRIGKTDNLKKRKSIYVTHMLHNKKIIFKQLCDNPLQFETCLKSMLYEYI